MAVPTDYGNLELWLKGDAGLYKDDAATQAATADGDAIAVWQDQSGNARHATQTTSGNRPTLLSPGHNGIDAVRFTGSSQQYLSLPNFLTGFSYGEIFAVLKAEFDPAAHNDRSGLWYFGSATGASVHNDYYPWTDGVLYWAWGSTTRKTCGNFSELLTNWLPLHCMSKASDWRLTLDGIQLFSTTTNTVGWTTAPVIGRNSAPVYFDGRIAEIFMYSAERSQAERDALNDYLFNRWFVGLTHRVSQEGLEIAVDPKPPHRVSAEGAEVTWDPHPPQRVSLLGLEIVTDNIGARGRAYII